MEHDAFISLTNTDFIVLLAFLLFIGVLVYFRVPSMAAKMLDERADGIRKDLDEAREMREEAQKLLDSYERKQREVQEQADRIVENARKEAQAAAEQGKKDVEASIERRIRAAEEQIQSAEESAVRQIRNEAVNVAIAAAREVLAEQMTANEANKRIDQSIETVEQKLH